MVSRPCSVPSPAPLEWRRWGELGFSTGCEVRSIFLGDGHVETICESVLEVGCPCRHHARPPWALVAGQRRRREGRRQGREKGWGRRAQGRREEGRRQRGRQEGREEGRRTQ